MLLRPQQLKQQQEEVENLNNNLFFTDIKKPQLY